MLFKYYGGNFLLLLLFMTHQPVCLKADVAFSSFTQVEKR